MKSFARLRTMFTAKVFAVTVLLVATSASIACSGGEIHLPGPAASSLDDSQQLGGSTSGSLGTAPGGAQVGGSTSDEVAGTPAAGGTGTGSTGSSTGGSAGTDTAPCVITGTCFDECNAEPSSCACEVSADCGAHVPFCDSALGSCVECLIPAHCVERFGRPFPACSAGRCVQCQSTLDCELGVACVEGWCGGCETDQDCSGSSVCRQGHCIPGEYADMVSELTDQAL